MNKIYSYIFKISYGEDIKSWIIVVCYFLIDFIFLKQFKIHNKNLVEKADGIYLQIILWCNILNKEQKIM